MKLPGGLRAFRHRDFRLFFGGQLCSMVGTWVQSIAQGWLLYRITGSPFLLGLAGFLSQIPVLLLASLAGLLCDRLPRRRLLLATQCALLLQACLLAALTLTGVVQVWHILALCLFYGVAMAFDSPVRQSLMVELVDDRHDLPNAIALNSLLMNSSRLVGPALAGILLGVTSEGACFLLNALSYLAILAAVLGFRPQPPRPRPPATPLLESLREGLRYARASTPVRRLLPLVALMSFAASPYVTLMPVLARDVLGGGPRTLAALVGAAGLGALCGTVWLALRPGVRGLPRAVAIASASGGASLLLVSRAHSLWLCVPLMAGVGFGIIVTAASSNMMIQSVVAEDKRGRIMSFYIMAFLGVAPLGALAAGSLAAWLGVRDTLALGGAACLAGAAQFARRLDAFPDSLRQSGPPA